MPLKGTDSDLSDITTATSGGATYPAACGPVEHFVGPLFQAFARQLGSGKSDQLGMSSSGRLFTIFIVSKLTVITRRNRSSG